jgi:hypothetical protein
MKTLTLVLALIAALSGCKQQSVNNYQSPIDSTKIGKIKSVLILGNSIVWHPAKKDIGWSGNWGMAATAIDSDFVHILIKNINQADPSVKVRFANIADFERSFPTYNLNQLDSLLPADMIIVKISENVDDKKAADSNFYDGYSKLITKLDPAGKSVKFIVDGFWDKTTVNADIARYASENKLPYVSLNDLSKDSTNEAWGQFADPGVQKHPSDKGMRLIAGRIWRNISVYFKQH